MVLPVLSYRDPAPTDAVRVSLDQLMVGGLLLQAGSGGGKSRAIRQALEETYGRVQHLVIDPEGEFASLRERFGYVYAAPHGGEAVATPKTARVLCRRLVEIGASAVLDIYDLKPEPKREFVRLFLEELMVLPRALWKPILVVVDEADFFAPQQGESSATEAILDLNARGRKRGYRMMLTTRRLSKLHKDAADLQNRMIGRTGLDLDIKRAGDELGMDKETRAGLAHLEPGVFYVYGPAISPTPQLVRTGAITTTHPEPGQIGKAVPPAPATVKALIEQLASLPQEAEEEAKTVEELRRRVRERDTKIRQLERGGAVREVEKPVTVVDQRAIDRAVKDAQRAAAASITQLRKAVEAAVKFIITVNTHNFDAAGVDKAELERAITAAVGKATQLVDQRLESRARQIEALKKDAARIVATLKSALGDEEVAITVDVAKNEPYTVTAPTARAPRQAVAPREPSAGGSIGKGERIILTAIAQYPDGADREQLTVLTGYKRSSRDTYIQRLKALGHVEEDAGKLLPTTGGVDALGDFEPLPTGEALQAYWLDRLGGGERAILAALIEAYPDAVARDAISEATGYKRSSRDTYLQRLGARKLIESVGRGDVRASEVLF